MQLWRRRSLNPSTASVAWRPASTGNPATASVRAAHDHILEVTRTGGGGAYGYAGLRSPAQAAEVLGHLSRLAGDLDTVFGQVDRYLRREDSESRLAAVDGPFTGDTGAAVGTAHMWLSEAAVAADQLRQALENAQIAAGGLARPARAV